jgi:hypothetical protein
MRLTLVSNASAAAAAAAQHAEKGISALDFLPPGSYMLICGVLIFFAVIIVCALWEKK